MSNINQTVIQEKKPKKNNTVAINSDIKQATKDKKITQKKSSYGRRVSEVLRFMKKKYIYGILIMVAMFLVFFFTSYMLIFNQYESTATIMIVNNIQTDGSPSQEKDKAYVTNEIINDSLAMVKNDDLIARSLSESNIGDSVSETKGKIKAKAIHQSRYVQITASNEKGFKSAKLTNAIAQNLCNDLQRIYTNPPVTATISNKAVEPGEMKRYLKCGIVGFVGLLIGLIIYIIYAYNEEKKDKTIFRPYMVKENTQSPLLMCFARAKISPDNGNLYTPDFESVRELRSYIKKDIKSGKAVMIVSKRSNEGRGSIAFNLAVSFAESGKNVLFIDANMQKQYVRKKIVRSDRYGLSDILQGKCSFRDGASKTTIEGLSLISSCTGYVSDPKKLMASGELENVIKTAKENYDVVIVDAPDVEFGGGYLNIAPLVDESIIVTRLKVSKYDETRAIEEKISKTGGSVRGVVITECNC